MKNKKIIEDFNTFKANKKEKLNETQDIWKQHDKIGEIFVRVFSPGAFPIIDKNYFVKIVEKLQQEGIEKYYNSNKLYTKEELNEAIEWTKTYGAETLYSSYSYQANKVADNMERNHIYEIIQLWDFPSLGLEKFPPKELQYEAQSVLSDILIGHSDIPDRPEITSALEWMGKFPKRAYELLNMTMGVKSPLYWSMGIGFRPIHIYF